MGASGVQPASTATSAAATSADVNLTDLMIPSPFDDDYGDETDMSASRQERLSQELPSRTETIPRDRT